MTKNQPLVLPAIGPIGGIARTVVPQKALHRSNSRYKKYSTRHRAICQTQKVVGQDGSLPDCATLFFHYQSSYNRRWTATEPSMRRALCAKGEQNESNL
jgi:hypothetical protein